MASSGKSLSVQSRHRRAPSAEPAVRGAVSHDTMREMMAQGQLISNADESVKPEHLQPASLDLTLGSEACKLPGCILPLQSETVAELLDKFRRGPMIDLSTPTVLERNTVYLVRLQQRFKLPAGMTAYTNSKSSTGRADVNTRCICDYSSRYDKIPPGYEGDLWCQVTSNSFDVVVVAGLSLNQVMFFGTRDVLTTKELQDLYISEGALLYTKTHEALPLESVLIDNGLMLTMDLDQDVVGYVAKKTFKELDLTKERTHRASDFWEPIPKPVEGFLWLEKGRFYIFNTYELLCVPPDYGCEMLAHDSTTGEFRAHYAGFFGSGGGWSSDTAERGTTCVLEVRAYEDDLIVRHRQPICRMVFERLDRPTSMLYALKSDSHYARQRGPQLSKHFM